MAYLPPTTILHGRRLVGEVNLTHSQRIAGPVNKGGSFMAASSTPKALLTLPRGNLVSLRHSLELACFIRALKPVMRFLTWSKFAVTSIRTDQLVSLPATVHTRTLTISWAREIWYINWEIPAALSPGVLSRCTLLISSSRYHKYPRCRVRKWRFQSEQSLVSAFRGFLSTGLTFIFSGGPVIALEPAVQALGVVNFPSATKSDSDTVARPAAGSSSQDISNREKASTGKDILMMSTPRRSTSSLFEISAIYSSPFTEGFLASPSWPTCPYSSALRRLTRQTPERLPPLLSPTFSWQYLCVRTSLTYCSVSSRLGPILPRSPLGGFPLVYSTLVDVSVWLRPEYVRYTLMNPSALWLWYFWHHLVDHLRRYGHS